MNDHLDVLEEAISGVGYWRWWSAGLPGAFQVEFGGVLLLVQAGSPDQPPSSLVALRFLEPSVVAFLTGPGAEGVPPDWRIAMHEDRLEPFTIDPERFTLTSEDRLRAVVSGCRVEYVHGTDLWSRSEDSGVLLTTEGPLQDEQMGPV